MKLANLKTWVAGGGLDRVNAALRSEGVELVVVTNGPDASHLALVEVVSRRSTPLSPLPEAPPARGRRRRELSEE